MNIDYIKILNEKLQALKESGSYRYFLDVKKWPPHLPLFYYENEWGEKKNGH